MRRALTLFFLVVASHVPQAAANDVGVVLLHGKGGSPSGSVRELAAALQGKGYLVSTPTMPWAKDRIYGASFEDAMAEIDREVGSLRQKGTRLVVVGGHSLGANAALGYGAWRAGADGIIALAPAHSPESAVFAKRLGDDVGRARSLVAAGKGKEKQRFTDLNQGRLIEVSASAEVYLSWLDPEGSAVMSKSAAAFKAPTPLLIVSVPTVAIEEVSTWLAALRH
jgi:pimeloyl-ACP methyl ester carboxylesterase